MRASSIFVAVVVLGASCRSSDEPPSDGLIEAGARAERAPIELRPADCAGAPLPLTPLLFGWSARQDLAAVAATQIVAVRYARVGCAADVTILDACKPPGAYRLRPRRSERTEILRDAPGTIDVAPLHPAAIVALINEAGPVTATFVQKNRLDIDPTAPLLAASFATPECAAATHVVVAIDLGRLTVGAGGEVLDGEEDPSTCDSAAIRPKGCDGPGRIQLVPLSSGTPIPRAGEVVKVGDAALDRMETSAAEYAICVADGACEAPGAGPECTGGVVGRSDHPINCVSWFDADRYCRFKGKRLPSEEEWATAAGAATFPWGDTWPPPEDAGNFADASAKAQSPHWHTLDGYDDGFPTTAPVDAFDAAATGLSQLAGNVAEWTATRVASTRVVRGSAYGHAKKAYLEVAHRDWYVPATRSRYIGIRCAR